MPLPLSSPRWAELHTRNGAAGYVPSRLSALLHHPNDTAAFSDWSSELCSEGTAWSAAYAAVPHLLAIAQLADEQSRTDYLIFIGLVRISEADTAPDFACPADLRDAYDNAVVETLHPVLEALARPLDPETTRYLLSAAAAAAGYIRLAQAIESLHAGCPHCGEELLGDQ